MYPVNYSKFAYYKIEADDLDSVEPKPIEFLGGGLHRMVGVGIVNSTKKEAAAQRFVDFLLTPWAQRFIARGRRDRSGSRQSDCASCTLERQRISRGGGCRNIGKHRRCAAVHQRL
jgi:hypothetical protein